MMDGVHASPIGRRSFSAVRIAGATSTLPISTCASTKSWLIDREDGGDAKRGASAKKRVE